MHNMPPHAYAYSMSCSGNAMQTAATAAGSPSAACNKSSSSGASTYRLSRFGWPGGATRTRAHQCKVLHMSPAVLHVRPRHKDVSG